MPITTSTASRRVKKGIKKLSRYCIRYDLRTSYKETSISTYHIEELLEVPSPNITPGVSFVEGLVLRVVPHEFDHGMRMAYKQNTVLKKICAKTNEGGSNSPFRRELHPTRSIPEYLGNS